MRYHYEGMWCGWDYRYVLFDLDAGYEMGEFVLEDDAILVRDLLNKSSDSA